MSIDFDMAHVVPPQSAPDWIKGGPLPIPTTRWATSGSRSSHAAHSPPQRLRPR